MTSSASIDSNNDAPPPGNGGIASINDTIAPHNAAEVASINGESAPSDGTTSRARRPWVYGGVAFTAVIVLAALLLRPQPSPVHRPGSPDAGATTSSVAARPDSSLSTDKAASSAAGLNIALPGAVQTDVRTLAAQQPARIEAVLPHEGDRVRAGQLLIRLDNRQGMVQERSATAGVAAARAQLGKAKVGRDAQSLKADTDIDAARIGLTQAQERLHQAQLARDAAAAEQSTELTQAKENVRKAQFGLEQARRTLASLEELDKVGGVARNDLEGARTQVATMQLDLSQAQAQVQRLLAGPSAAVSYRVALAQQDVNAAQTGVQQARDGLSSAQKSRVALLATADRDIEAATANVEQARAGAAGARAAAGLLLLTSPQDGVVSNITAHAGELAQPGVPLLSITALTGYRVEALATARELPALHIGQQASVRLDALPGKQLTATLVAISRVAEPDGRSFRIKLRLEHSPTSLRPGQTARIQFPSH